MSANILIVDDNEVNRMLVSKILRLEGYHTTTACCGREAIQSVIQSKPDLVILDVNMPDMDGYDVCKQLRRAPINATMPVVMLTATADESDRRLAKLAGANDMITKPFDMDELRKRIRVLIE